MNHPRRTRSSPQIVDASRSERLRALLSGVLRSFYREAEVLAHWRRRHPWRRHLRPRGGRSRSPAASPGSRRGPPTVTADSPPKPTFTAPGSETPGSPRRRRTAPLRLQRRPRGGALALLGSLALHIAVFSLLLLRWFATREPGPSSDGPPSPLALVYRPPTPRPLETNPPVAPVPAPPVPETPVIPEAEAREPAAVPVAPSRPRQRSAEAETAARASARSVPSFAAPPPIGAGRTLPASFSRETRRGGPFASRGAGRLDALRHFGGDGGTEDAVARGLRWLAEHQDPDGSFRASGFQLQCGHFEACPGEGLPDFDAGVTALAALAFLGAGNRPDTPGPFQLAVARALAYLVSEQDPRGAIGVRGDKYLYNHAIATLALVEASHENLDARSNAAARSAVRFLVDAQQDGGGWDYVPERTGRHDLSVSGWAILALHSARAAGHAVPPSALLNARHFLARAFTSSGDGIYANKDPEAGRRGPNMSAVGLLSHLLLDGSPEEASVRRAAARLLRDHPPQIRGLADWDRSFQSYYFWYAATLALFHLGERSWDAWNELLKGALLPLQSRQPHRDGSWDPEPSWIGKSGGRVYSTAINVLTLEVYYRYPPLFSHERR